MAPLPSLAGLPIELLVNIVEYLDDSRDISSVCRLNSRFHWLFFDYLLSFCAKQPWFASQPSVSLLQLYFHAVKHNSANIIQWLTADNDQLDLKGYVCERLRVVTFDMQADQPSSGFFTDSFPKRCATR